MTSRPYARIAATTAACLGLAVPTALAAPSSPTGGTGGAGLNSTSTTPTTTTPTTATATIANPATTPVGGPVSAAGNGITLTTTAAGTYRQTLTFTGSVPAGDRGDVLAIQRQTANGTWHNVTNSTVAGDGSFSADWHPSTSGVISFRASIEPPAQTAATASAAAISASPSLSVTIYRNAIATIYGPGFYGHKTACGQKLTPNTIGVASRTLKCGTEVSIDYDGRSLTVPVIDRGPYANGATWDLTIATAKALADSDTETIGAAVL